jgi:hypothetical protein
MAIKYVRVRHSNGVEDMVPELGVCAREAAGQLQVLDPTPCRYRKISAPAESAPSPEISAPVVPVESVEVVERPKRSPKQRAADLVATDSAADAATTAEEATK